MAVHLNRQIEKLKKLILQLGARAEQAVHEAIQAIEDRDIKLAQQIIEGDAEIDEMEIDVEEECLHTLALYQPVAQDLRFVVATLKINSDLERIGDLAANMAEQATFLAAKRALENKPFDLHGMGSQVLSMVQRCLDALVNVDPELAQSVRDTDNQVDQMHREVYRKAGELIRQHPDQYEPLMHMVTVSRQLERIADHATNIAEDVLYMSKGAIFRHRPGPAAKSAT